MIGGLVFWFAAFCAWVPSASPVMMENNFPSAVCAHPNTKLLCALDETNTGVFADPETFKRDFCTFPKYVIERQNGSVENNNSMSRHQFSDARFLFWSEVECGGSATGAIGGHIRVSVGSVPCHTSSDLVDHLSITSELELDALKLRPHIPGGTVARVGQSELEPNSCVSGYPRFVDRNVSARLRSSYPLSGIGSCPSSSNLSLNSVSLFGTGFASFFELGPGQLKSFVIRISRSSVFEPRQSREEDREPQSAQRPYTNPYGVLSSERHNPLGGYIGLVALTGGALLGVVIFGANRKYRWWFLAGALACAVMVLVWA